MAGSALRAQGEHAAARVVAPASGRWESLGLLLATLAVIAAVTGYLLLRPEHKGPPEPLSWQVRSFDGLGSVDQAIHGALLPAGEEIVWNNNDTGGWVTMDQAQKMLLPPFYRDTFWKANGQVHWELILPGTHQAHTLPDGTATGSDPSADSVAKATLGQGAAVYYGSGGQVPGQSAYLLVIGHAHAGVMWANQATIWVHRDTNDPYPHIVKPESRVDEGWRQVIPYDGASEVERVKGNQP